MNENNQNDIDSLLDTLDTSGAESELADQVTHDTAPEDENTGQLQKGEVEVVENEKASEPDPRGKPWVDFVPEFDHPRAETLVERLDEELENLNECLADKEDFRVLVLEQGIHSSYLRLWVENSNSIMRAIVRIKDRRNSEQTKKPLKEA